MLAPPAIEGYWRSIEMQQRAAGIAGELISIS